jgi:AAA family ATP:ADP antiporter
MSALPADRTLRPLVLAAMGSAAVIVASQVAARATRDTLFLTTFPVTALPAMVAGASVLSIAVALAATRATAWAGPERFVPATFLASAALTLAAWAVASAAPAAGAIVFYLHAVAIGPVLVSGFWSLVNERLDPRSARGAIGRIAAAGTLGGLAGGIVVERVSAGFGFLAPLLVVAAGNLWCAWSTSRLRPPVPPPARPRAEPEALPAGEAFRRLLSTPYLRNLALLVFGGAATAALLDWLFKAQLTSAIGGGQDLMRAFAFFYTIVAVLTFVLQTMVSRRALERVGIAPTIGTLPAALLVGGTVAAVLPGPWSVGLVRAIEAILRGSLFRAGYELLYTPIPAAEKRATRTAIDVACDRLGDLAGAALLALVLAAAPGAATPILFALAVLLALATLAVVVQVQRGYVSSLEAGLRAGGIRLDPREIGDRTTLLTLMRSQLGAAPGASATPRPPVPPPPAPDVQLASGVREAIHLLASDEWARGAVRALVGVAAGHVDLLVDTLLDPATEVAIRRRLPAVLVTCPVPRAVEGLTRGLADPRFEVRYRCGRALARLLEGPGDLRVEPAAVLAAVRREAELGRAVWESQRLLDALDEPAEDAFVDEFLRDRAGRSLEHAFTLLSLVLPREPLRIAFRGLFAGDRQLRGTSLEYLELVLPPDVREVLWPHLDPESVRRGAPHPPARDRERVLADLVRSDPSIEINLAALRRQHGDLTSTPPPAPGAPGAG